MHSPFNAVIGVLKELIRQQKKIKGIETWKQEVKLSLFADGMILYIREHKNSTRKRLESIHKIRISMSGYWIYLSVSLAFLYRKNKNTEKEIINRFTFHNSLKTIRYLGINFTKDVNNLYSENIKSLKKK